MPITVGASSSKTVSTRSSPPLFGPPTCSISRTVVELSGLVSSTFRSPTKLWSMLSIRTSRSLMRPLTGTNRVETTPPALSSGIGDRLGLRLRGRRARAAGRDRDRHGLRPALGAGHVQRRRSRPRRRIAVVSVALEAGRVLLLGVGRDVRVGRRSLRDVQRAAAGERRLHARRHVGARVPHALVQLEVLARLEHAVAVLDRPRRRRPSRRPARAPARRPAPARSRRRARSPGRAACRCRARRRRRASSPRP